MSIAQKNSIGRIRRYMRLAVLLVFLLPVLKNTLFARNDNFRVEKNISL
jgi:hypothetical protein